MKPVIGFALIITIFICCVSCVTAPALLNLMALFANHMMTHSEDHFDNPYGTRLYHSLSEILDQDESWKPSKIFISEDICWWSSYAQLNRYQTRWTAVMNVSGKNLADKGGQTDSFWVRKYLQDCSQHFEVNHELSNGNLVMGKLAVVACESLDIRLKVKIRAHDTFTQDDSSNI